MMVSHDVAIHHVPQASFDIALISCAMGHIDEGPHVIKE